MERTLTDSAVKARASEATYRAFRRARALFWRDENLLDEGGRQRLDLLTRHSERLETIYQYRLRLQSIWSRTSHNSTEMLEALKQWCRDAEASGVRALEDFARALRAYTVQQSAGG